jgi:hypothetical protein
MGRKASGKVPDLLHEFRAALEDCQDLYRSCATEYARSGAELQGEAPREFIARMVDLHRGLVLKLFLEVAFVDATFSEEELQLAKALFKHLWGKQLNDEQLRDALVHVQDNMTLSWGSLLSPFEWAVTFRERADELKTLVIRLANLIAKADGSIQPDEVGKLHQLQRELQLHLERIPVDVEEREPPEHPAGQQARQYAPAGPGNLPPPADRRQQPVIDVMPALPEVELAEALAELDALVGLGGIKREIRGLVNYLQVQKARAEHHLAATPISLHTVFKGNPGTGKTTVARLLGRIFAALGLLRRGHLVETDRSGLVAEYAGQTAPKTHKKIDEALDGVLFIDEAYSLVAEAHEDPYGDEAVQVMLKRMEDDRDRLVVILAGYPQPMDRLLASNPGLSSRFPRILSFPDYSAAELGNILLELCRKNQYELPVLSRVKLLLGFQYLLERRDEGFGNGRLARNLFERAIGQLANRIAAVVPLTRALLTTIEPADIVLEGVPEAAWEPLDSETRHFRVTCPGCRHVSRLSQRMLGRKVQCKRCQTSFQADWGEVLAEERPTSPQAADAEAED